MGQLVDAYFNQMDISAKEAALQEAASYKLPDPKDDANAFLKNWYTARSKNLDYSEVANSKLKEFANIQYRTASDEELKSAGARAFMNNGNKIYTSNTESDKDVFLHEATHVLDSAQQKDFDKVIKENIISEDEFHKMYPGYKGTHFYEMRAGAPSEISARLNVFRSNLGIDPNKKYSDSEMQNIIDNYKPKTDQKGVPTIGTDNILDLFMFTNKDGKKLNNLNRQIVANRTDNKTDIT